MGPPGRPGDRPDDFAPRIWAPGRAGDAGPRRRDRGRQPHRLEVGYRLGHPRAAEAPSRSAGPTAGSASTSGCLTSTRAGIWRCGYRLPSSTTGSPCTSTSCIEGTDRPHTLDRQHRRRSTPSRQAGWSLLYPAAFTALSPMLVMAPADTMELRRTAVVAARAQIVRSGWSPPATPTPTPTWARARRTSRRGSSIWPPATSRGCTATPSRRWCGARAGHGVRRGHHGVGRGPRARGVPHPGSAGGSSRPGPATAGSTRRSPRGRRRRGGASIPASPSTELGLDEDPVELYPQPSRGPGTRR